MLFQHDQVLIVLPTATLALITAGMVLKCPYHQNFNFYHLILHFMQ